jgi:hypothetical protein
MRAAASGGGTVTPVRRGGGRSRKERRVAEECRSCHAEVYWALPADPESTSNGMPLEKAALGDPAGNVDTWRDSQGVLRYRYIRKAEMSAELPEGHLRAVSHFATCSEAASWRRKGKRSQDA